MKKGIIAALFAGALVCCSVQADVYYKWKDSLGTVHYAEIAPRDKVAQKVFVVDADPSAPPVPAKELGAEVPAGSGHQTSLQKADSHAVHDNCAIAQQNIASLEGRRPVTPADSTDVRTLTPEQRQQALTRARTQATYYCPRKP